MSAFFPSNHMETTEVLTGIMGITVILMNLYRLIVSITGFEEVEDWPLWHHISGFTEAINYIALAVCLLMMVLEVNELSEKILTTSLGASSAARLFAAEYGTKVTLPCDENVQTPDEESALSVFDAVWTDPRGGTLVGGGEDQDAAELRGDPWVDAYGGDLSLSAVDFADAGEYACSARYADGEELTEVRESRHILQVYEDPVDGHCECGCELVANVCLACSPGQYGEGGSCHPCPIGRFNEQHAALCCPHCPYLYVTWGRGAKSKDECSGVLRDFLIGLAVLACLYINLYALFKFTGPVVFDALCEYIDKEASISKARRQTDSSDGCDDALDSAMPENVFDGISRLIVRLKERKLREISEEGAPLLLPASRYNGRSENSESSEGDSDNTLPSGEGVAPEIITPPYPTPTSRNKIASGETSFEDAFLSPGAWSFGERGSSSTEGAATSPSEVAFVGSPVADWIATGRRQWVSRYQVFAERSESSERCDSALPDQRQATYDLFVGRLSNEEADTSRASHSSKDKEGGITGTKVRRSLGSFSGATTNLDGTEFGGSSVMHPSDSRTVSTRESSSIDDIRFRRPWAFRFRPEELKQGRKPTSYGASDERGAANPYSDRAHGNECSDTEGPRLQRPETSDEAPVSVISRRRGNRERNATVILTDDLSGDSRLKRANTRGTAVASHVSRKRQGATYRK